MKQTFTFLLFTLLMSDFLSAQIVISEIHYNNDGYDDNEFIELYNDSGADIQMEGYYIGDGFDFTFPNFNFEAGAYMVVAFDPPTLLEEFGVESLQWTDGTLSSSGEDISIYAADSTLIDYVDYEDNSDGWSAMADGRGTSLSLCDVAADNEDPANWQVTSGVAPAGGAGRTLIYASPGAPANCASGPIVGSFRYQFDLIENNMVDTAFMSFSITNANGMPTTINIAADPSSTVSPDEYEILDPTITFDGLGDSSIVVRVVPRNDDANFEGIENLILNVTGTNVDRILTETINIVMYDDDFTSSESLVLVGVFNADIIGGANEFGVELYALKDIPDLSVFGVGAANNGGGTDGIEIQLPAVSLNAGDNFFISDSKIRFSNFFGFESDHQFNSIYVTGNDAIELFEHGVVIDTYGERDVDGEGTIWDYEVGWAVRWPDTSPDGSTFVPMHWAFGGTQGLTGETNSTAISPYPLNTYIPPVSVNELETSLQVMLSPNPVENVLQISFDVTSGIDMIDVSIYNVEGRLVVHNAIENGQAQAIINVADLPSGLYFATLKTAKGLVTKKFAK